MANYSLITGATSGIGLATANALAAQKRNLILIARREERLSEIKRTLTEEHGIDVKIFALDLRDTEAVTKVFDALGSLSIDVAVNNAGLARGREPLETYDWNDISEMFETNIRAFTLVAKLAIPFLKKTEGHLVNISSISATEAYANGAVYCGTKAYVKMVSHALRMELLGTNVRVTDIAPGMVDTEFSLVRYHGDDSKAKHVYEGFVPLHAEDIADCIVFALNRPKHVNIDTLLVMPTAQAGTIVHK